MKVQDVLLKAMANAVQGPYARCSYQDAVDTTLAEAVDNLDFQFGIGMRIGQDHRVAVLIGGVLDAAIVVVERSGAGGCIKAAGVRKQRLIAGSGIAAAADIVIQRLSSSCRVGRAHCRVEEGLSTNGHVIRCGGIVIERLKANGSVIGPAGEAKESRSSLGGVVPRIASVRRWTNGFQSERRGKIAEQGKNDQKEGIRFHGADSAPFALHTATTK